MLIECPDCHAVLSFDGNALASAKKIEFRCEDCHNHLVIELSVRTLSQQQALAEPTQAAKPQTEVALPAGSLVALAATSGPMVGHVFRLTKPRLVVGRADADIQLDDPEVSRKHCIVEVRGTTALLTDLETTNGTVVEGEKIQNTELRHLSEFQVGGTTLMFTVTKQD
jgi:pSer/pThr/pTyr-binding forkhead associated (FHA) protein